MKIEFANSFSKSIKRLIRHNTWWYKTYSMFSYDLPRFFKNVWKFRDALWNHYWFDHHGTLRFLEISLTDISNNIETKGNEIEPSRSKKVQKMRRAVEIIQNYNNFHYLDMAEKELGELHQRSFSEDDFVETGETVENDISGKNEKTYRFIDRLSEEESKHNRKVYNRATEIEDKEWREFFEILKGQNYSYYQMFHDKSEDKEKSFDNWFDGSGIKGWLD